MDGPPLFRIDGPEVVDGFAENIQDAAEGLVAHRNGDRFAEVDGFHAAHHAVGRLHGDAANLALADVVRHFDNHIDRYFSQLQVVRDVNGVVDRRQMAFFEFDVHRGTDDLDDASCFLICHAFYPSCAAAPETISMISLVIDACRIRL